MLLFLHGTSGGWKMHLCDTIDIPPSNGQVNWILTSVCGLDTHMDIYLLKGDGN